MHSLILASTVYAVSPSALFAGGAAFVALGTLFRLRYVNLLVRAEEHAKEGLLSEEQARRRMAVARYSGPALILVGVAMLGFVLLV
jgi:hypothetical protein